SKLGKYEIRSLLGQGGMAAVYLAYQSDIDRDVAVKVLPPHPGQDPQFMERFQQEARTIARLQHPHILPVFDFGVENGILYLVMPYVGGGSLKNLLQGRRLPPQRIIEILTAVAAAVDYAHRQGVIHRDIKPDNILLDKEGHPILTDFGIAKLLESNAQFTASGGFLGTPAYMAPEQGRGVKDIDGRADIYALGVLAFEMLTGRHPYSAETPMMVMFKHVSDPVPSLLEVAPEYPPPVDAVLQRALAKDREARYQTAADFSKALTAALTGQTDTAVGSTTAYGSAAVSNENVETLLVTDTPMGLKKLTQAVPPSDPTIPPTQYYPPPQEKRRGGWLIGALTLV
ncbi:MAG: serine/threonine protein kinase, partial [Anaerolineae bacterium]|nr:serine/threonine protein kinase [Anaerolineae bacterium]